MKELLFVINTLGRAGAETALVELLNRLDPEEYRAELYVLANQGDMVSEIPKHVRLLNRHFEAISVLDLEGQKALRRQVWKAMFNRLTVVKCFPYLIKNFCAMLSERKVLPDKLLWRVMSDGGQRMEKRYDLAVAFLEGGASYYVSNHVKADRKAAFLHVDYGRAGYTRSLDRDCYLKFDKIFAVSGEVKEAFLEVYPECESRTDIFHNLIDGERIHVKAKDSGGFEDDFSGQRILTVGRLTKQKAFEISVEAMKLLKDEGLRVRWYVLGEGDQRKVLEEQIRTLGLEEDFLLLGAVDNPYPYMLQADVYVHASRYEGKSIAIQEAQILGKAILVSDCSGNREQVEHDVDGMMCDLSPAGIAAGIGELLRDEGKRKRLGEAAACKHRAEEEELNKLLSLL